MPDQEGGGPEPVSREVILAQRASRQRALVGQEDLVAQVAALFFRHDPIGIDLGTNTDEYRGEAEAIVLRLPEVQSPAGLQHVVHEVFVRWFGAETARGRERYAAIAAELWELVRPVR